MLHFPPSLSSLSLFLSLAFLLIWFIGGYLRGYGSLDVMSMDWERKRISILIFFSPPLISFDLLVAILGGTDHRM
jgi:hypothetical protein